MNNDSILGLEYYKSDNNTCAHMETFNADLHYHEIACVLYATASHGINKDSFAREVIKQRAITSLDLRFALNCLASSCLAKNCS